MEKPTKAAAVFVESPVFQNWCHEGSERDKTKAKTENPHSHRGNLSALRRETDKKQLQAPTANCQKTCPCASRAMLAFFISVCLVSITSFVLTTLVLFGKVGDRCGCPEARGTAKPLSCHALLRCTIDRYSFRPDPYSVFAQ